MHKHIILHLVLIILLILSIGVNCYQFFDSRKAPPPIVQTDTITLVKDSIVYKEKVIYTTQYDTLIITNQDTIFVELPIEHKQYKDTITKDSITYNLDIRYSGFHPSLDTIQISTLYYPRPIIKKQKWTWGVNLSPSIGYGVCFHNGNYYPSPFVGITLGVGLHYNF